MFWKVRGRKIPIERTLLMGIVNITPDSFSDGGLTFGPGKAVAHALHLISEGADILDFGAESTRPGAKVISVNEELTRLLPVLKPILSQVSVPVSIDTTKPEVAKVCLELGAHIINDVSGLKDSGAKMAEVVRDFGAGLVLMHRRGNPETMQSFAQYKNVTEEVFGELEESLETARRAGVFSEQLVVDPGLGFSKTPEQNLEMLRHLEKFASLNLPVLLGPSRKSFIGKLTGREVGDREWGTAAVAASAVLKGIQILRIHEVGPMRDVVRVAEALRGENYVGTF